MNKLKIIAFTSILLFQFTITFGINYSMEERSAYDYAYKHNITTMNSIDRADMYGWLTRIAMAKMLSNYAINILGLTPDTTKDCTFTDVSLYLDAQYDNWVTKACQLWIMWVGIEQFYPHGKVTRIEFWTALSRALNANDPGKLKEMNNSNPYYKKHLNFLRNEWIMNNTTNATELRWWVLVMLMRADTWSNYSELAKTKYFKVPMALITRENPNEVFYQDTDELVYRNEIYGIQTKLWQDWKWWTIYVSPLNEEYPILWFAKKNQSVFPTSDREIYWFQIIDNDKFDEISSHWLLSPDTLKSKIKWKNNKYTFVWDTAWREWDQKYLPEFFPNLKCNEYTQTYQTTIGWEPVVYTVVDCNGYEKIGWELVKTWKSWIEQLFPAGFEFFDVE